MSGKNRLAIAVLTIGLLAGLSGAAPAPASSRDACADQACRVKSLQSGMPRARFPACNAGRYLTQIGDADAGVLRMCQRDGGWEAVGGSSGGGSSTASFFVDAGSGVPRPIVSRLFLSDGAQLAAPPTYFGAPEVLVMPPGAYVSWITSAGELTAALVATSSNLEFNGSSGLGGPQYYSFKPLDSSRIRAGAFLSGVSGSVTANVPVGESAFSSNSFTPWDLGAGSNDFLFSDGTNINTAAGGGLKIGGFGAAAITLSPRCFLTTDGGTVPASSSREEKNQTCAGVIPGAECITGNPGGDQTFGIVPHCYVKDNSTVNWIFTNDDTITRAPVVATYSCRCFNP